MRDLENKTAIITGTNRGLGRELLIAFAQNGCNVVAISRHDEDEYISFLKRIASENGVSVYPFKADFSNIEELNAVLKAVHKQFNTIDVLVNNAGVAFGASFHMTSINKLKEIFDVNYFSQVAMMQAISRKMLKQKSGSIINIASVGGIEANPGYLAYGSSKAALIFATECLSKEIGPHGVRVNAIAPGLIDTQMGHYKNDDELQKVIDRTSLRKMGSTQDVVSMALYLASDKSAFITGQIIKVDGGR